MTAQERPAGALAIKKLVVAPPTAPSLVIAPTDPSTDQAAFFLAQSTQPTNWRWQIDGGPTLIGQANAVQDYRTFQVTRGQHIVNVWNVNAAGTAGPPATFGWLVSDIVVPIPTPQDLLGCGLYTIYVVPRGGGAAVGPALQWSEFSWARAWSDAGAADVTLDGLGSDPECCRMLDMVTPWAHELLVYRDDEVCWQGPITYCSQNGESGKIEAMELPVWFKRRRVNTTIALSAVDEADAMLAVMDAAMCLDRSPQIQLERRNPTGTLVDLAVARDSTMADQQLANMIRSGVGYAASGRRVLAGAPDQASIGLLLTETFQDVPESYQDGLPLANDLLLTAQPSSPSGQQVALSSAAIDDASIAAYGLHQSLSQESVDTQAELDRVGQNLLAVSKDSHVTFDKGVLSANAPLTINELVCGAIVDVRVVQCLSVLTRQRISGVAGAASRDGTERVELSVQTPDGVSGA